MRRQVSGLVNKVSERKKSDSIKYCRKNGEIKMVSAQKVFEQLWDNNPVGQWFDKLDFRRQAILRYYACTLIKEIMVDELCVSVSQNMWGKGYCSTDLPVI